MKSSLLRTFTVSIALALGLLATTAKSHAGYIVNTGEPTANYYYYFVTDYQEFGAEFQLTQSSTVTGLDGWIGNNVFPNDTAATIGVNLFKNDPNTGTLEYSGSTYLASGTAASWVGASGLNLNLGAGNYFLEFTNNGVNEMQEGAPNPLPTNLVSFYDGAWQSYPSSALNIGIQVTGTVPDATSTALLFAIAGLVMVTLGRRWSRQFASS